MDNFPVKVDVTASAKLEVKAELPPESAGRALDAMVDVIRPFTEARGLKADLIRLHRADVALLIAKKTRDVAELDNIELKPIPLKMLVPFLEKASLEDVDEMMRERWSALLLSASQEYRAHQISFIDILSRLSSHEIKILEEVALGTPIFPTMQRPQDHDERNADAIDHNANLLEISEEAFKPAAEAEVAFTNFLEQTRLNYGAIIYASAGNHREAHYFYTKYAGINDFSQHSLEILEREGLITRSKLAPLVAPIVIGYFNLTYMGIQLVKECSFEARKTVKV